MKEEGERKAAQRKREERRGEVGERKVERGGIEEER